MSKQFKDITGKKVKNFTVISYSHGNGKNHFWNCKCDCGQLLVKSTGALNWPASKGCLKCGQSKRVKPYHEKIFNLYKDSAERRGIGFDLTLSTFKKLIENYCTYCGTEPSNHFKNNKDGYMYNGIDRVNNKQHYHLDNCVTCCKNCNQAKHAMEIGEFLSWLNKIVKYRENKV